MSTPRQMCATPTARRPFQVPRQQQAVATGVQPRQHLRQRSREARHVVLREERLPLEELGVGLAAVARATLAERRSGMAPGHRHHRRHALVHRPPQRHSLQGTQRGGSCRHACAHANRVCMRGAASDMEAVTTGSHREGWQSACTALEKPDATGRYTAKGLTRQVSGQARLLRGRNAVRGMLVLTTATLLHSDTPGQ